MNDAQRLKALYNFEKPDRLPRREFYIWEEAMNRWKKEGWDGDESIFKYDLTSGIVVQPLDLGWTEAPIVPGFKEEIVKVTDKYEYVRFHTGEVRMYPIGKRHGVMPMFAKPAVESPEDWYNLIKPRLNPETKERWVDFDIKIKEIKDRVDRGEALMDPHLIGGYMYLRSLCGPENIMYLFYDNPEIVHDMMKTWLHLQVECLTKIQDYVPFWKIFLAEDRKSVV